MSEDPTEYNILSRKLDVWLQNYIIVKEKHDLLVNELNDLRDQLKYNAEDKKYSSDDIIAIIENIMKRVQQ